MAPADLMPPLPLAPSLQDLVGHSGLPAGRLPRLPCWPTGRLVPGGRRPLDPAPSEGLFKIVVYMVHDFGHIIDY